jgi:predicted transposase/invertase (TIGR01784 family)
MRHYKFTSQVDGQTHVINSLQLIQYNIMYSDLDKIEDLPLREWMSFWQKAHEKTDADLAQVQTKIVKKAYERMRVSKLSDREKRGYINDYYVYENISDHIQEVAEEFFAEGMAEGIAKGMATRTKEIAINMLKDGVNDNMVMRATKLTLEELQELKKSL